MTWTVLIKGQTVSPDHSVKSCGSVLAFKALKHNIWLEHYTPRIQKLETLFLSPTHAAGKYAVYLSAV